MFIIGDVHGQLRTLEKLIEKFPDKTEPIVFVGDLIDRGPLSRQTIEFVMANGWQCVRGNHEMLMLAGIVPDFPTGDFYLPAAIWRSNGGTATLKSYRVGDECLVPVEHIEWIKSLPVFLRFPDVIERREIIVSHAALTRPYRLESAHTGLWDDRWGILWYRGEPEPDEDRFYVYGHTPRNPATLTDDYARIDTGAYNVLTALRLPQYELYQQEAIDHITN